MDINKTLQELYSQKARLETAIAALEELQRSRATPPNGRRRGRKSMSAAERMEVSARMTRYWARQGKQR